MRGSTDDTGTSALFNDPRAVVTDGNNLYISDSSNNTIRKLQITTLEVTTMAGRANEKGSIDDNGLSARFNYPTGITHDTTNLYVTDYLNHTIRKIAVASGEVTTLAGTAGSSGSADGTGSAARFYGPRGIATDGINLYVVEAANHTVRKLKI